MQHWKAAEAKRRFSQLLHQSEEAPQVVLVRDTPVSVVVSYEQFVRNRALGSYRTMDDWLDELSSLHRIEGDPAPPDRGGRRDQFVGDPE